MTFNPNIPQANDDLSDSQPQILANFSTSNTSFGQDHYEFADLTVKNGHHKKVTWEDQTASLPLTAAANQVLAYGQTQSSITMPYYTRDALATVYPLAPIKSYAIFQRGANGVLVPQDSFNVTSITQVSASLWTVVMTNACRTTNYGIFFQGENNGFRYGSVTINATTFQLNANGSIPLNTRLNFQILET